VIRRHKIKRAFWAPERFAPTSKRSSFKPLRDQYLCQSPSSVRLAVPSTTILYAVFANDVEMFFVRCKCTKWRSATKYTQLWLAVSWNWNELANSCAVSLWNLHVICIAIERLARLAQYRNVAKHWVGSVLADSAFIDEEITTKETT